MTEVFPVISEIPEAQSIDLVEFTDTDRERIIELIDNEKTRLSQDYSLSYNEHQANTLPFRRALRDEGEIAAAVILDSINNPIYREDAMIYLELCAQKSNAAAVLDFMINSADRGIQTFRLVRTMQRIAHPQCIPGLVNYVNRAYDGDDHCSRATESLTIALSAEQREEDAADRLHWSEFVSRLASLTTPGGVAIFSKEDVQQIKEETAPGIVALDYVKEFFVELSGTRLEQKNLTEDRLKVLRNLYKIAGDYAPIKNPNPSVIQRLTELESQPTEYAVSLGIEVEILQESFIDRRPDTFANKIKKAFARYAKLNLLIDAEMPVDSEDLPVLKEFSLAPASHYSTLAREVQLMMAFDVLNPDYKEHPLHLTIGNITSTGPRWSEAFLLARCLEATGWCSSGQRIRQPLRSSGSWAHRGAAGVHERPPKDIHGDADSAVEFRTLSIQSLDGLERTLRSAYALGAALSAYQTEQKDETQKQLSGIWEEFAISIRKIFADFDIGVTDNDWYASEKTAQSPGDLCHKFSRLADLLDQAATDPASDGAHLQDKAQREIISVRRNIFAILHPNRELSSFAPERTV